MTNDSTGDNGAITRSGGARAQWIRMDLGAVYPVSTVVIGTTTFSPFNEFYSTDKDVEYSTDGLNWTFAFNTGSTYPAGIYDYAVNFNARYIRIITTSQGGAVGISEFYALIAGQVYPPALVAPVNPPNSAVVVLMHFDTIGGKSLFDNDGFPLGLALTTGGVTGGNLVADQSKQIRGGTSALVTAGVAVAFYHPTTLTGSIFNLGTGDFTIEAWVIPATNFANGTIVSTSNIYQSSNNEFRLIRGATGNIEWYHNGILLLSGALPTMTWRHVAVVRYNGVTSLYIDGMARQSIPDTRSYSSNDANLYIAATRNTAVGGFYDYYAGNIDEVRICKGHAVYRGDFNPELALPYEDAN